jgi:hypothetical protein
VQEHAESGASDRAGGDFIAAAGKIKIGRNLVGYDVIQIAQRLLEFLSLPRILRRPNNDADFWH